MVLLKLRCPPGAEEATLSGRITTSAPTLSLSSLRSASSDPALNIQIHLRCLSSTKPLRAITIFTSGTIFNNAKPEEGHMDNLALGMLGPGLVCNNSQEKKSISLGYFRTHRARQDGDEASDLRQRPETSFITVPSQDSGDEVTISHILTSERLFAYSDGTTAEDLVEGEKYTISLRQEYVGTTWWCWGGLDDELQGKKLHAFSKGICLTGGEKRPSEKEMDEDKWVCGEDVAHLKFRVQEGYGSCTVEVVK